MYVHQTILKLQENDMISIETILSGKLYKSFRANVKLAGKLKKKNKEVVELQEQLAWANHTTFVLANNKLPF